MDLLRKKSKVTKLLILRELVLMSPKDQRSVAEAVCITPQGVSEYLKKMEGEGLVDPSSKPPKATIKGVEMLQRDLLQLKDFIDRSIDGLEIVRSTDAIAASGIRKGDKLRIFIDNGLLYCEPGEDGPSTGIAENHGDAGEIVIISGLSGVVEIPDAILAIVEIEPARKGGGSDRIHKMILQKVQKVCSINGHFRTAVLDQEAASLMIRSGLGYQLEIPRAPTLVETLDRGINIICFGTPHSISHILTSQELSSDRFETCRLKLSDIK